MLSLHDSLCSSCWVQVIPSEQAMAQLVHFRALPAPAWSGLSCAGGKTSALAGLPYMHEFRGCFAFPAGHAYAAVISACAAGGDWQRAVSLFDEMLSWQIKPDVVSCTALITALGADAQWQRAEQVVDWMHRWALGPLVQEFQVLLAGPRCTMCWPDSVACCSKLRTVRSGLSC